MQTFRDKFEEFAKYLSDSQAARAQWALEFSRDVDQRRAATAAESRRRSKHLKRSLKDCRESTRKWLSRFATRSRESAAKRQEEREVRQIHLTELKTGVAYLRSRFAMERQERRLLLEEKLGQSRKRLDEFNEQRAGWRAEFRDARRGWEAATGQPGGF